MKKTNQGYRGRNREERVDSKNTLNIEKTGLRECIECGD